MDSFFILLSKQENILDLIETKWEYGKQSKSANYQPVVLDNVKGGKILSQLVNLKRRKPSFEGPIYIGICIFGDEKWTYAVEHSTVYLYMAAVRLHFNQDWTKWRFPKVYSQ